MIFEISESKDVNHILSHATSMIITSSVNPSGEDFSGLVGQVGTSVGHFDISNDKYYSNRESSRELNSHLRKCAPRVKVLHLISAPKLQLMTSLSTAEENEIDCSSEGNRDLESFVEDLEKLLDSGDYGEMRMITVNLNITKKIIPGGSFIMKEHITSRPEKVKTILGKKVKSKKGNKKKDVVTIMKPPTKKSKVIDDGLKVIEEKKPRDKPLRGGVSCRACGQMGHIRTNKKCPKYEHLDIQVK